MQSGFWSMKTARRVLANDMSKQGARLPPERQAIRAKCFHPSGTFEEFPKEEIEQSIPEWFEKIVRMYPDYLAVKMEHRALYLRRAKQSGKSRCSRDIGETWPSHWKRWRCCLISIAVQSSPFLLFSRQGKCASPWIHRFPEQETMTF